jgi:hypothetical protein
MTENGTKNHSLTQPYLHLNKTMKIFWDKTHSIFKIKRGEDKTSPLFLISF